MAIDLNSGGALSGNGGAIFGEDRPDNASHEDQLSIRHSEDTSHPLTIVIGNAIQGRNYASGSLASGEDIRPARVWIVADPWGDVNNANNQHWPQWWVESGAGGWEWRNFDGNRTPPNGYVTPEDLFKNALSIDMRSDLVSKDINRVTATPNAYNDGLRSHAYSMWVQNRVYAANASGVGQPNCGEVAGIMSLVTIEDVGDDNDGHVTDAGAYLGAISFRAPIDHNSFEGTVLAPELTGPFYACSWESLGFVHNKNDKDGSLGLAQPDIRCFVVHYADFVQSVGPVGDYPDATKVVGKNDTSMVRYGMGFRCRLMDGSGIGGNHETYGYSAGFVASPAGNLAAIELGDANAGNRRVYGYLVEDLGTYGVGPNGTDPRVFGDLIGFYVSDQNTGVSTTTSECNIWGVKIGDLKNTNATTTYPATVLGLYGMQVGDITTKDMPAYGLRLGNVSMESGGTASEVLSIKTEGGDIHFSGTGATGATIDAKIGDADNRGRLTVGLDNTWAKDAGFKPFVSVEGELELDAAINTAGILNTPTAPSLTSGHAHEVLGMVSSVYTSDGTVIKSDAPGGGSADPYAMIAGFLGGTLLTDSPTVNSGSVMAGVYAYILDNGSDNPTVDDMAALVGDYPAVVDIGDLEGTGSIKSAFGLYTLEPDPGDSGAGTAAAVFDGDVVVGKNYDSNQSKIYLNGDSKWRTSSAMTKGSATIGYASSQIQIHGADASVDSFFHLGSKAKASAPNGTVFLDSTDGKLYAKDNNGSLVALT